MMASMRPTATSCSASHKRPTPAALDSERQTVHSLLEELGEAYRELERAREADRDKADALAELATVREQLDRAYSKASGAETDLEAERRSVETLRADLAETHEELERTRQARATVDEACLLPGARLNFAGRPLNWVSTSPSYSSLKDLPSR